MMQSTSNTASWLLKKTALKCHNALYALIHSAMMLYGRPDCSGICITAILSYQKKPLEYFCAKRVSLSQMRLDKKGKYNQETAKAVKVSYEIAMLIAKNKKPHTIGENLVKPCIVNAVKILLGDDMAKQFKNISLSDSTQVLEKVKCFPFFAISCDESVHRPGKLCTAHCIRT
ncbi:Protein ZBED8, partial [Trichinella sp. T6]